MRCLGLVAACLIFLLGSAKTQVPVINNQFSIGGTYADQINCITQSSDGGYFIVGYSSSNISGDKSENSFGGSDYWIVKTNASGVIEWQNTIGGTGSDIAFSGEQTADGGFIVGGTSSSGISGKKTVASKGGSDYWILKLNSAGVITWQQTYGGTSTDELRSIHELSDGNFIVGGQSSSGISGNKTESAKGGVDYWILKLDSIGNILWQNTIGSSADDRITGAEAVSGGGFIVAGNSTGGISADKNEVAHLADYWVLKLNDLGDIVWQNTVGGGLYDYLNGMHITVDGGVLLAGNSNSNASFDKSENTVEYLFVPSIDYWIVKLGPTGVVEWNNTIGGAYTDIPAAIFAYNGGYIVSGQSGSDIIYGDKHSKGYGQDDIWTVFLDVSGNILAQSTIGGSSGDYASSIAIADDGEFIIGGYSHSNVSGNKTVNTNGETDYWVITIDSAFIEYDYTVEWEDTIGGLSLDMPTSIVENTDGSYLVGGRSNSAISGEKTVAGYGDYDYWIVKYTHEGNVAWQNAYGGTGADYLTVMKQTPDGGYILGGYSNSPISGNKSEASSNNDYWVIKIDNSGNIQWQNVFGGNDNEYLRDIVVTSAGNFVLSGYSNSGITGDKTEATYGVDDYWVIQIDAAGNMMWQKTIGGSSSDFAFRVLLTPEENVIVGGYSSSPVSGNKSAVNKGSYDYWVVCLTGEGTVLWDESYGSSLSDYFSSAIISDNGILLGGYSSGGISFDKSENNSGGLDLWFVKTDFAGNIMWENTFGGPGNDYLQGYNLTSDDEDGFTAASFTDSGQGGDKWPINQGCTDVWILKFDSLGNNLWQENFGDNSCEDIHAGIYKTLDQGYIFSIYVNGDYWIIKLNGICTPTAEICNSLDDNCNGLIDDGVLEAISISAGGPITFCQGGGVLLTATYSGVTVQWKKNGSNITGATTATYTASTKGNYSCVTTSDCGIVESTPIFVNVLKNPNASITAGGPTTFCLGGSVTLTETPVAGCTYQWYKGASPIAGATSTSYVVTTAGNYKCRVTKTATGCYKNSNAILVTVPCREGEEYTPEQVLVYPNPSTDIITIHFNEQNYYYCILDMSGKLLMEGNADQALVQCNLQALASGMYVLRITADSGAFATTFNKL